MAVRDERKLGEMKTNFRKESQKLAGYALNVVLASDDDECSDLVPMSTRSLIVIWFLEIF
jgi:hypothetical protein